MVVVTPSVASIKNDKIGVSAKAETTTGIEKIKHPPFDFILYLAVR